MLIELTIENTHELRDAFSLVMEVTFVRTSSWGNEDNEPVRMKRRVTIVHVPKLGSRSARGEVTFDGRGDCEIGEGLLDN